MPTTVREAFRAAGLEPDGVVPWGTPIDEPRAGVYVVSLTIQTDSLEGALAEAPLSMPAFELWLEVRAELTLDGARSDAVLLAERVAGFWLPDEVIVYIGKAASLATRVGDYYTTPLGARRPHAGGYFVKLLSNLGDLYVHYAAGDDPAAAEDAMVQAFCAGVSEETLSALLDPAHPIPFANLEWPQGVRKAHGLRGARESKSPRPSPGPQGPAGQPDQPAAPLVPRTPPVTAPGSYRTQRVTEADLRAGQIRIPISTPTKSLFPSEKVPLRVVLRGAALDARWDPRMGPDRERSGVLRFADKAALQSRVRAEETLWVTLGENGVPSIG
jgi:hypothetical protein